MLRFLVRRLLQAIPTLLILSILIFAWLRSLPGGPAGALLGDKATPEKIADLNKLLGLDDPIFVQYFKFLGRAITGDFGNSLVSAQPVMSEIGNFLPATIELGFCAMLIAVGLGIPFGYLSARFRGGAVDNVIIVLSLVGVAVPVFFLGYMMQDLLAAPLGLPSQGRQMAGLDATTVTGFAVFDGIITQEWDAAWDALTHLILPAFALATIPLAVIVRITRASVLDVLNEDFIRTANSKGLTQPIVRRRHVLRNGLLPVVTVIGLQTGALLGGAVLTERVFNFRGLGFLLAEGIERRDYPRLQALLLFGALVYVLVNMLVDISYGLIDPRVRVR
ncbi:ABC transporter permease [Amycolatopsis sp. NPDC058340]|uniref:Peptide ABC transporter permease n=2 Tax=Amycolatopsis TaxID=1813 RepID=A0A1W2M4R7_9PSEU|nr:MULTISPECIES: ABC transporter permease [Amycolatopsis]MBE1574989.1 peptide/nickel transport system permease protein [Amycolatopsis roodepoortensis]OLZ60317.1 peptide ABC transporter permease [Amycolatopsis keratiniphila subsp. nogabecina]ONF74887.1 peptide ABC transporter permease [Amycolatopsis keratiniphila subsp. keratiniphila]SDU58849.1 peptide/nickel transport system permease protein [Amycolatopsis keratiniphila]